MHSDEKLFEKLQQLENNVIASTHLVYNSIGEVNKAYSKANTNLSNTINVFNNVSSARFVENLIEEDPTGMSMNGQIFAMDQTTIIMDNKGEDERLTEALDLAIKEISDAKKDSKEEQAQ